MDNICEIKFCKHCRKPVRRQNYLDLSPRQWDAKMYCGRKFRKARSAKRYTDFNQINHGLYAPLYQNWIVG